MDALQALTEATLARVVHIVDLQSHAPTQVHRASQFACSRLALFLGQGQSGLFNGLCLPVRQIQGVLRLLDAVRRVVQTLVFQGTATKARAANYFNKL